MRVHILSLVIVTASLAFPGIGSAEIYRWVDENGTIHFSDKPPQSHSSEVVKMQINTYENVTYEPPKTLAYGTSSLNVGKKVVMYSASWCGVCKIARRYFKQKGIKFTEYDVEKNSKARATFKKLGGKGVPVILVGNRRMNGFSINVFNKLYK